MSGREFTHDSILELNVRQEGGTLYAEGTEAKKDVTYSDEVEMKRLATRANHTADGLFDLITRNCNIDNPDIKPSAHFEIYISLAGLTCEIYMKSLIYYDTKNDGKQLKTHDFRMLFGRISQKNREVICEKINDIDRLLPSLSELFKHLRYDYEFNHIEVGYSTVFDLMKVLKTLSNGNPAVETGYIRCANGEMQIDQNEHI